MVEATIEEILAFIGITHDNVRQDAYNHWKRFIEFIRDRTPAEWKHDLRPKLRSYIGVDFRYIDDYYECCLSWGIMKSNNGFVDFVGIPEGQMVKPNLHPCPVCGKEVPLDLKFCSKDCVEEYKKREQQKRVKGKNE